MTEDSAFSPQAAARTSHARKRILVVDDDEYIRHLVADVLLDEGYDVLAAPNGQVALDFVHDYRPHLILLDMNMPVCSGWDFVRRYRAQPESHAPIVVLTAAHDVRLYAAQVRAEACLGKPFDLDDLMAVVREHGNDQVA